MGEVINIRTKKRIKEIAEEDLGAIIEEGRNFLEASRGYYSEYFLCVVLKGDKMFIKAYAEQEGNEVKLYLAADDTPFVTRQQLKGLMIMPFSETLILDEVKATAKEEVTIKHEAEIPRYLPEFTGNINAGYELMDFDVANICRNLIDGPYFIRGVCTTE